MKNSQQQKPRKSVNPVEPAENEGNLLATMRHEESKPVEMGKVSTKRHRGQPTVMTPEVVSKLELAFAIGSNVTEACIYADISRETLYAYIRKNPEFSDRIEGLKSKPILKAKQTVVQSLDDPDYAFRYLERRSEDFKPKAEVKHSGGIFIGHLLKELRELKELNNGSRSSDTLG